MKETLTVHRHWAQEALQAGHTTQARCLCNYMLQQDPLDVQINALWYEAQRAQGSPQPRSKQLYRRLWNIRLKLASPKPGPKSLRLAHQALEQDPRCSRALRLWAQSAQALDAVDLACLAYEKIIQHTQHTVGDFLALSQLYQKVKRFEKSLLIAEEGAQAYPECHLLQKAIKQASLAMSLEGKTPSGIF